MQRRFRLPNNCARGHQSKLKFAPDIVDIRPGDVPSPTTAQSVSFHSTVGREPQEIHIFRNDDRTSACWFFRTCFIMVIRYGSLVAEPDAKSVVARKLT